MRRGTFLFFFKSFVLTTFFALCLFSKYRFSMLTGSFSFSESFCWRRASCSSRFRACSCFNRALYSLSSFCFASNFSF